MQFGRSRSLFFGFLLALVLLLNVASCGSVIGRRQDGGKDVVEEIETQRVSSSRPQTTIDTSSNRETGTRPTTAPDLEVDGEEGSNEDTATITVTAYGEARPTSMAPGGTNETDPLTKYQGGLPIQPTITPGIAVAGVLLLGVGLPYCLIGIKRRRFQIFLSTTYLTSLGVTVLIIYVMNPPVSNAVEGGYVAAATVTGIVFGLFAVVFPEVTETLGCLLGGFCISMWFLVLKPGGLITSAYGKLILIGAFSFIVFSLAFHRVTKPYALIATLSFSGATSVVLGIDCFSKAGLKEFWLYIWDLNDNMFPIDTNTYPHTRGIRVEIAVILIITAFGIMSQVKLWKILRERRELSDSQKKQRLADIEALDEDAGKRIEERDREEREKWEKTFGNAVEENVDKKLGKEIDNETDKESGPSRRDSGVVSRTDSGLGDSVEDGKVDFVETEEMKRERQNYIQLTTIQGEGATELDVTKKPDTHVTIDAQRRSSQAESQFTNEPKPQPLVLSHIHIPHISDGELEEDVMSLATFADTTRGYDFDDEGRKRLSVFSMRSMRSMKEINEIVEEEEEKSSSLAVTCDAEKAMTTSSTQQDEEPKGVEVRGNTQQDESNAHLPEEESAGSKYKRNTILSQGMAAIEITVSSPDTETKDVGAPTTHVSELDKRSSGGSFALSASKRESENGLLAEQLSTQSKTVESTAPTLISLSSQLPAYCSKVFKTYRTNEWAKHLADAEDPQVEDLTAVEQPDINKDEVPVPVRVMELQETPTSRPTPSRPISRFSVQEADGVPAPPITFAVAATPPISRPVSKLSFREAEAGATPPVSFGANSPPIALSRPPLRISSVPVIPEAGVITESPVSYAQPPSPVNARSKSPLPTIAYGGNTLLTKRESMIRSRPSFNTITLTDQQSNPQIAISNPQAPYQTHVSKQEGASASNHRMLDDNMSLSERRNELLHLQQQNQTQSRRSSTNTPIPTQPPSPTEVQNRREQALQTWRENLRTDPHINPRSMQVRSVTPDHRRTGDALNERQQALKVEKQRESVANAQWSGFVEQRMRQPDMLEAHREAMRRLQAGANKVAL